MEMDARTRWSGIAFALVLVAGNVAHGSPCWYPHDNRPYSISSWNPPKTSMISCPWKAYKTTIDGYEVEGRACDWSKIRCDIKFESCVQTSINISEDRMVYVACLPHVKKPMEPKLTQPPTVSRRRRSERRHLRRGCRKQRRKMCPNQQQPALGEPAVS